jgi:hypothetical protein
MDAAEIGDLFDEVRAFFRGDEAGGLHGVHHELIPDSAEYTAIPATA